jgi:hypothetical protein
MILPTYNIINEEEEEEGSEQYRHVHILPIVPDTTSKEVEQLEMNRKKLFEGIRNGAKVVLQLFLPEILKLFEEEEEEKHLFPLNMNPLLQEKLINRTISIDEALDMLFPPEILLREMSFTGLLDQMSVSKGSRIHS